MRVRKMGGRTTPKGTVARTGLSPGERAGLEKIFDQLLGSAQKGLSDDLPPVAVEMWASELWSTWAKAELVGMSSLEVFGGGLIGYAAKRATPGALMVLRALAAVAPPPYGPRARREAERLAGAGIADRGWASVVGSWRPTTAWLYFDPVDDDAVSVIVCFDGPGGPNSVGLLVDQNLGGIAKDVFVAPGGSDEVLGKLDEAPGGPLEHREISLKEAAARWREAFGMTDATLDPPVNEDLGPLRALVMARLAKLPPGGQVPCPAELSDRERDHILAEFIGSDEAAGLSSLAGNDGEDYELEHLAHQVLTFSLDYTIGTPLRFSPAMVEIFCLDWAPRKIAAGSHGFAFLPDVLAAWIRFAGRRRGIPEQAVTEAVEAAHEYAPEMIELSRDPANWGPAKVMALAVQQSGIDIRDQADVDHFVAEVNRNGGIDVLARSLVASMMPRR